MAFSHGAHMKYHHKLSLFVIALLLACLIVFKIGKAHEIPKRQVVYYSEKFDTTEDIDDVEDQNETTIEGSGDE